MNLHRVAVIVRRHWLVLWRSPHRWFEVGFWPLMDVILWGSLGVFVAAQDSGSRAGTAYLLAGIVLFHVLFQVQITATTGVMEETWTRNLLNILTTPVTELEYTVAVGFFGLLKTLLAMAALTVTTIVLFGFDLSEVGWSVIPVAWILVLNGWALALVVIGLILRYGQSAEILTWGLNYVVMALSGVFFPVESLPPGLRAFSSLLPTTWAFAELRDALDGQPFDWPGLLAGARQLPPAHRPQRLVRHPPAAGLPSPRFRHPLLLSPSGSGAALRPLREAPHYTGPVPRIAIGSDHAGYLLKQHLIPLLTDEGHEVTDLGTDSEEPVDYPIYCSAVGRAVRDGQADLGIVLGGSGQGEQLSANKVRGVRAALCNDLYTARFARAHNDANVLSMGARVVGTGLAELILRTFLTTPFEGGRHAKRLAEISALEDEF